VFYVDLKFYKNMGFSLSEHCQFVTCNFASRSIVCEPALFFSDDCIYLFFVCTDKASGAWPENKLKCTKTFDACQGKLGLNITELGPDIINGIDNSIGQTSESETEIPQTTEASESVVEVRKVCFFKLP
jgi:hypothetical protein